MCVNTFTLTNAILLLGAACHASLGMYYLFKQSGRGLQCVLFKSSAGLVCLFFRVPK